MEEGKSGLYIVAIVAVIAVVAMVVMITNQTKSVVVQSSPAGVIALSDADLEAYNEYMLSLESNGSEDVAGMGYLAIFNHCMEHAAEPGSTWDRPSCIRFAAHYNR